MKIPENISSRELEAPVENLFALSKGKIRGIQESWKTESGAPVFTRRGKYTARGWTEWTQGFQFGMQLLQFDATEDEECLAMARENTMRYMARHVSHIGVHDHGFNNISTYGNLRRLAREGRLAESDEGMAFYELALQASGAVQAARWTTLHDGTGYIYSFNGPHSLFSDTVRSCRSLVLAHQLGHCLMGENDKKISLLQRAVEHLKNTAKYNVFFGKGRDAYDVKGRVAHEGIFNTADGRYRCPSTQQGYSPFSTWTRGLAWVILGFAEQYECFKKLPEPELEEVGGRAKVEGLLVSTAMAAADYYLANTPADGIPYWDTGAPGLAKMPDWMDDDARVDNPYEPVDSSAAAIAAQGLLRLGKALGRKSQGWPYYQAGLAIARRLFGPPYLSEDPAHQGLILHSVYHRPNNWDYVPEGKTVPQGESSMWGDYHAMELGLYVGRAFKKEPYYKFFND